MTDQEKQKLNEKLAKWAGFKESAYYETGMLAGHHQYSHLDGTVCIDIELPKFTDSLDACFKWAFKPVCDYLITKSTCYADYQRLVYDFLIGWIREVVFNQELHKLAEPNMEALCFCLAAEKLIEGGA